MGYFREQNADEFDRLCAEDDLRREAREAGPFNPPYSEADSLRVRSELDEARRVRLERERIEREEYRAAQDRMNQEEKAAHAYVSALVAL
jgi:hypothetical protein